MADRSVDMLNDLDRFMVGELARDGRVTSSDLAAMAGVSKATAASRVRRLIETEVVRVTAVFDIDAAGYQWQVNCFIKSMGVATSQMAKTLSALAPTWAVHSALGRFDVVAAFIFADKAEMADFFTQRLPNVDGVGRFESDVVVKPLWFEPIATNVIVHARDVMQLVDSDVPIRFPNATIDIDELDDAIMTNLRIDGRRSNRRLAQDLNVSEGTIRARIKRLQEANLMRIVAWIDPEALGHTGHVLYLRIVLGEVLPETVSAKLVDIAEINSVSATIGWPGLTAMALAADGRQTRTILRTIRSIDGVVDVDLHELVDSHFYRSHLVRIPGTSVRPSGEFSSLDRPVSKLTSG